MASISVGIGSYRYCVSQLLLVNLQVKSCSLFWSRRFVLGYWGGSHHFVNGNRASNDQVELYTFLDNRATFLHTACPLQCCSMSVIWLDSFS